MARAFTCVECATTFERRAWTKAMAANPVCGEACKKARRERRAKKIETTCATCGTAIVLSGRAGLQQARKGRGYCSTECSKEYRRRISAVTLAATNRRFASARMKAANPMHSEVIRERVSDALKAMGHRPPIQGGNGRGLAPMEMRLLNALPLDWTPNHVVRTNMRRSTGYPGSYKLDLAYPEMKIAIEVDGSSHCALANKEKDAKKQAFLESLGWRVLRFTNAEVRTDLDRCVRTILSSTSRSTETTTTSSMAS